MSKTSEILYPNAHSSARRFRGEVVRSAKQHNARVAVVIALHPGCASRELVLSLFDHFLTFAVLNVKTSEMVYPNAHSSERRFRGEVVCSSNNIDARVAICLKLHAVGASRELVLSLFDHF